MIKTRQKVKNFKDVEVQVVTEPIQNQGLKIGIMGGTFNPPHLAHLTMADQVGHQLGLDKVLFIPDYLPPHIDRKETINAKDRVAMVKLAIKDNPLFDIDLIEINRTGRSYSFDTVKALKEKHPNNQYYFIIGGDMVNYLPKWYRIDDLVKMVNFVGVNRPNYQKTTKYPIIWVDTPQIDLSSTKIRNKVKNGESIKYLVPNSVYRYIKEHHLYEK